MQIYNSSYILETQQSKQQMNTFGIAGTSNQSGSNGRTVDSPLHRAQPQRRQRQKQGEGASVKVPLFPVVLYGLLEDAEKHGNASIVSWRPSGVAFKVYRREEFVNKILPKYFKQTKFKSFVRQLNLWGFTCIERGQDKGSYHHQMFIRGRPEFCKDMRRQRIKGNGTSAAKAVSTYGDEKDEASPLSHRTTLGVASIIPSGQSMMHPSSLPSSSIASQAAHIIPRSYPDVSSLPAVDPIGFNSGFRPGLHPNHGMPMDSNGDWVDKLERVFGPTTSQMESMFSAGDISEQLEPRPIKMPQTNPHTRHPF